MAGEIIISAPGKVILHGEHAVVYGKPAVAASLNLRTTAKLRPHDKPEVTVSFSDLNLFKTWNLHSLQALCDQVVVDLENPEPPSAELLNQLHNATGAQELSIGGMALVTFLYLYLALANNNGKHFMLVCELSSDLPLGAGLGSSAAMSVCLSTSLLLLRGAIQRPAISSGHYDTWMLASDLELINKWALTAEKIIHGTPSGIDNSVSTYGGSIKFEKAIITPLLSLPHLDVLLVFTKTPRSTKKMVANVKIKLKQYPEILEPILNSIEAITNKAMSTFAEAEHDLSPQQFATLQDLVDMNQQLLRCLGVSHASLEHVCQILSTYGLPAKLTGAGGGGCAFALLPKDIPLEKLDEIKTSLKSADFECWVTRVGTHGVCLHRTDVNEITSH